MRTLAAIAIAIAVAWGAYGAWLVRPLERAPGVLAAEEPLQSDFKGAGPHFSKGEYEIQALAAYRLRARLLSRKAYHLGRESDLAPLDFAVGWGPMSDSLVLAQMQISQSVRFFTLRWRTPPLAEAVILDHASNMHLIPADATVRRALDRMRPGEIVELEGYLVQATAPDGWSWHSSLTRTDRGAGACELMWVERALAD